MLTVKVNFRLSEYLPESTPSTKALQLLQDNFNDNMPNLAVYVENISIPEALVLKQNLSESPGVQSVFWLDDVIDVYQPLEMADPEIVKSWFKDGTALFSLSVEEDNAVENIDSLKELIGKRGLLSGQALNNAAAQNSTSKEIPKIILFIVPLTLIILLLSTGSWFEPVLFMITIGAAILINEGTNAFLGEVSFITKSAGGVLLLAVSMDYAVFLLHRFTHFREEGLPVQKAMAEAMVVSFPSIAASAVTTIIGFLVLALMRFKIGPDMGIVMAKGIIASFISVMFLLPAMTITWAGLLEKGRHRSFLPSFENLSKAIVKICVPLAIIGTLLIIPGYWGQEKNIFIYGSSGMNSEDSQAKRDADKISSVFGESVQMVLLVPNKDNGREKALSQALEGLDSISSVVSYPSAVGLQVPEEFLPEDQLSPFRSNGYSRLVLYANTLDEGDSAFKAVEDVRETAARMYGDDYYLTGLSVINYDLKDTIVKDNWLVTIAVTVAIGIVLLVTFRSLSIPLILLLAIKGATWINLSLPYFSGTSLNYLGYQIVSSVQLGATVDYGILFVHQYFLNRKFMTKGLAAQKTIADTTASILTPASILITAGLMLGFISSNKIISQLGTILGRGAMLSAAFVLLVLPGLLILLDKIIKLTTIKGSAQGVINNEEETIL